MRVVPVALGERAYRVTIGAGAAGLLPEVLPRGARLAAVVSQPWIDFTVEPGIPSLRTDIGEGEAAKVLSTVEDLCRAWARAGLTRGDVVVAVGGGVVTDVAGFAAAVYHRGTPVVHVPTSLLAMVDAAVGGKTGVNLPEGKNLVGAFWQPVAVLCDLDALVTLPPREQRSGWGELAKYHFLTGEDLLARPVEERIATAVAIKAGIVAADERDAGRRALLNYGHTLAHALETGGSYDLRHGEAVAIGLVFAAHLAARLGRIGPARVEAHRRVVASYDLPVAVPPGADDDTLVALMGRDKKAVEGLTFVLDGPAGVEVVPGVPEDDVRAALAEVRSA